MPANAKNNISEIAQPILYETQVLPTLRWKADANPRPSWLCRGDQTAGKQ